MKLEIKITEPIVRGEEGGEKEMGGWEGEIEGGDGRDEMRDREDKAG